ncbi:sugar phosphate isomerase/epimerase [Cryobacterium melibiosiphilum]|nr:sugar phosphate isomerase/epimerase [Cryobacterium melibiosiphilum]
MSTTCVSPLPPEQAFRLARQAGFDGLEIMVTEDSITQDAGRLCALSERFELPILSIHAPVLPLTYFVWGVDARVKLEKSAQLAVEVGATTVVVHPPFRWQVGYAVDFLDQLRQITAATGIEMAVENMFPWQVGRRRLQAYAPGWNPSTIDCDAVTLDFSHAALSGVNSLELATALGDRLRHVHLCDGSTSSDEGRIFDEHLLPGRGNEPVAEVLQHLAATGWTGQIVAEVNTRKAKTEQERLELLLETVAFARLHTVEPRQQRIPRARRAIEALGRRA